MVEKKLVHSPALYPGSAREDSANLTRKPHWAPSVAARLLFNTHGWAWVFNGSHIKPVFLLHSAILCKGVTKGNSPKEFQARALRKI